MNIRIVLAATAAAIAIMVAPGLEIAASAAAPVHSSSVAHHKRVDGPYTLCASKGTGLCAYAAEPLTDSQAVFGSNAFFTQVDIQHFYYCNGKDTVQTSPACPFTNGSGLNSQYAGDDLIDVAWHSASDYGLLTQPGFPSDAWGNFLSHTGNLFVHDGTYGLVNVYASNAYYSATGVGQGQYLETDGTAGDQLLYGAWSPNKAQWLFG